MHINSRGNMKLKKALQHHCQLPDDHKDLLVQFIASGYFVKFRRIFKNLVICSARNPRCKAFFKSAAAIHLEVQTHLQFYYYMIHPFSMLRIIWEFFMMFVLFVLMVYIPLDACFTSKAVNLRLYRVPRIMLDTICLFDIAMHFATGYQDSTTRKVVMDPKMVATRYLKTWFAIDLISSINTDIFIIMFDLNEKALILKLPSFLKVYRVIQLFGYIRRYREWKEYSLYFFKMANMVIIFFLWIVWSSCLLYLIADASQEKWLEKVTTKRDTIMQVWHGLKQCTLRVIMNFLLVAHGYSNSHKLQNEKSLKKSLVHDCQLPNRHKNLLVQFIDSGYFVNFRRKFRSYVICSENNPRSKVFLKSSEAIYLEIQNHLQFHHYMIHPFSAVRVMWEMFMMVVLFILLIYIPVDACFTAHTTVYDRLPRISLDFACIIDIIMSFLTGYQDDTTKKIIMNPRLVAVHYLRTWFLVDLISSINIDIFVILFNLRERNIWMRIPSCLKIFHVTTLVKYLGRFRERKETSLYRFKMLKMSLLFVLSVIWSSCTLFVIATFAEEEWMPKIPYNQQTLLQTWSGLRSCLVRVVMNFLLLSHGGSRSNSIQVLVMEILFISIGWIFKLGATAQIIQIVMKYSSLNDKYYQMVQQFQEYMKSKSLPETVQKRVLAYFEFRFQRNYYKENEILGSLSNQLKQEITVHTCGKLLNNTVIFRDIPQPFLVRASYLMKMEIYLPNDVVVIAGSEAQAMYFILTGMVAVYDKFGKEVCHLADGSYFGEMSLFLSEKQLSASVVSIDFCEMYTISKTDFAEAITPYPDLREKLEKLAKERLKDFLTEQEARRYSGERRNLQYYSDGDTSRTRMYYNI